jgi:aspartyl protease family protein
MKPLLAALALLALQPLLAGTAHAQSVAVAGRMGDRALIVVNGTPHTVAVGASGGGVKLLRWVGDEAEVEVAGTRALLRVGGTPAQVGAVSRAPAREIVMTAGSGGHFTPEGAINGRSVRFIVDTGATLVALGQDEAQRLGLNLADARGGVSQTANGPVSVQIVVLDRVRVGGVEIFNVGAVVMPQSMPYILLGNSFLSRFQMRRDNDVMRLELK